MTLATSVLRNDLKGADSCGESTILNWCLVQEAQPCSVFIIHIIHA